MKARIHFNNVNQVKPGKYSKRSPDYDVNLLQKSQALVNEAAFIGLIRSDCKAHYLCIARTNVTAFNALRDILSIEKAELVKQYDYLLRHGKLSDLHPTEYEKLHRAKWLVPSKCKPI